MILVTVCQKDSLQFIVIFYQIADIWNNDINPEHFIFRKTQTTVNHNHFIFVFNCSHIFSDFLQSTQWNNFNFVLFFCHIQSPFSFLFLYLSKYISFSSQ